MNDISDIVTRVDRIVIQQSDAARKHAAALAEEYWGDDDYRPEYIEAVDGELELVPDIGIYHHPEVRGINPRPAWSVLNEFDRHPHAAANVALDRIEADHYRRISLAYAGLS